MEWISNLFYFFVIIISNGDSLLSSLLPGTFVLRSYVLTKELTLPLPFHVICVLRHRMARFFRLLVQITSHSLLFSLFFFGKFTFSRLVYFSIKMEIEDDDSFLFLSLVLSFLIFGGGIIMD